MLPAKIHHLFSTYAASTLDKQRSLLELLGKDHRWEFAMKTGIITFNKKHAFQAQVLGTEATGPGTWLWSWANTDGGIPPALSTVSTKLKAAGYEHGIDEFTKPEFPLGELNGIVLAAIAVGMCRGDAYYRGAYEGGAILLILNAPPLRPMNDVSSSRVVSVFTQLIAANNVDHRKAWKAYLTQKGYKLSESAHSIQGLSGKGDKVQATFDEQGRAIDISASLGAR